MTCVEVGVYLSFAYKWKAKMQQDNYVDVIPDFVGTSGRSTLGKQIQILLRVDTTLT